MNKRIDALRKRYFDTTPEVCPERARYFTQSMKETEGEYIALRRAKAFANVLENMTIFVADNEIIVGNLASTQFAPGNYTITEDLTNPMITITYPVNGIIYQLENINFVPNLFFHIDIPNLYKCEVERVWVEVI